MLNIEDKEFSLKKKSNFRIRLATEKQIISQVSLNYLSSVAYAKCHSKECGNGFHLMFRTSFQPRNPAIIYDSIH